MLEQGERLPAVLERGAAPPLRLLAHVVAGALEPRYREALKLRVFGSGPSLLPRPLALVRDVVRSLWPSRARVEALAGRHGSGCRRASSCGWSAPSSWPGGPSGP